MEVLEAEELVLDTLAFVFIVRPFFSLSLPPANDRKKPRFGSKSKYQNTINKKMTLNMKVRETTVA